MTDVQQKPIMISVSVWFVAGYALLVSAVLVWMTRIGASAAGSAEALAPLVVAPLALWLVRPGRTSYRQAVQMWVAFVVSPTSAVWTLSRTDVFRNRAWLLVLVGPTVFLVATAVAVTVLNIFTTGVRRE